MHQVAEFQAEVVRAVARFFAQNGRPAPAAETLSSFAAGMTSLIAEHGLPAPLAAGECGAPGGLPDDECVRLVGRLVDAGAEPLLSEAARQLVKACFHPEFTVCRDSFRETARDGTCRRQELARVRKRISGTHCVDCPHWVALSPADHAALLQREWKTGPAEFAAHQEIFLPEDFRALRQWLHAAARSPEFRD